MHAEGASERLTLRPPRRDARSRLQAIACWIGTPAGRGRIVPSAPVLGAGQDVRTFEADGTLGERRVRLIRRLGAGLAGTVYLAEDDAGITFVEKHFGAVPAEGNKRVGRWLADGLFALFRQAPLSFRELPEAAVAGHLANRFVVALSHERFGFSITPPLLYTRYDPRTGGYVQAFQYVQGRPLRPCEDGLPLFGEASLFRPTMRRWRDFLSEDLGLWGLARQVDPANPNSFSNLWVTQDRHVLLLDVVPGLPGFLEPRYLWLGLIRGELPPFGDAIDFDRLSRSLRDHGHAVEHWQEDLELMKEAVAGWKDAEPKLCSSPCVRCASRRAHDCDKACGGRCWCISR